MLRKKQYKNLNKWKETAKKQKQRYYGRTANSPKNRDKWTDDEIEMILAHEMTDNDLAIKLNRSVHAIQSKRKRLKAEREKMEMFLQAQAC